MTKRCRGIFLNVIAILLMGVASCGENSSSAYKDNLTFGTGIGGTGFDLVGEGTSFSVSMLGTTGQIWFKLESATDIGGRAVRLYINGGTYAQKDYPNPQSYGHYLLSSFRITDVGSYTIKAYLVEQAGADIGKETLVTQSTLTIAP